MLILLLLLPFVENLGEGQLSDTFYKDWKIVLNWWVKKEKCLWKLGQRLWGSQALLINEKVLFLLLLIERRKNSFSPFEYILWYSEAIQIRIWTSTWIFLFIECRNIFSSQIIVIFILMRVVPVLWKKNYQL